MRSNSQLQAQRWKPREVIQQSYWIDLTKVYTMLALLVISNLLVYFYCKFLVTYKCTHIVCLKN